MEPRVRGRPSSAFALHVIELPKVSPEAYDALSRWARFFQTEDPQELERLTEMDPNIAKAVAAIEELSSDPVVREIVRMRELANINWRHSHACAIEEGREEGREEGERRMLVSKIEQLAAAFGVTDASRSVHLQAMTNEQLERVFAHVLAQRAWPDGLSNSDG